MLLYNIQTVSFYDVICWGFVAMHWQYFHQFVYLLFSCISNGGVLLLYALSPRFHILALVPSKENTQNSSNIVTLCDNGCITF